MKQLSELKQLEAAATAKVANQPEQAAILSEIITYYRAIEPPHLSDFYDATYKKAGYRAECEAVYKSALYDYRQERAGFKRVYIDLLTDIERHGINLDMIRAAFGWPRDCDFSLHCQPWPVHVLGDKLSAYLGYIPARNAGKLVYLDGRTISVYPEEEGQEAKRFFKSVAEAYQWLMANGWQDAIETTRFKGYEWHYSITLRYGDGFTTYISRIRVNNNELLSRDGQQPIADSQ